MGIDWKTYEEITKYIYETLGEKSGVKIIGHGQDCKVEGLSGVKHQIDVLASHTDGIHTYKTAIECKYWKDTVNKDIVMKVAAIIEDASIDKGVIVSKNGFTNDAFDFAKYKNIRLVELKEIDEKLGAKQRKLEIGVIEISQRVSILRPEILNTEIEYLENDHTKVEVINIYNATIKVANGNLKPFTDYTRAFQNELHIQKNLNQFVTKRYEIPGGHLINNKSNSSVKITGLIFTGILKQIDSNSNLEFSLVDEIWLIMKSIFEEKSYCISRTGIIKEDDKK